MSLKLGPSEQVVKDWMYATCEGANGSEEHCLTVTNKRVVAHQNTKKSSSHIEIAIDSIKGMEISSAKASSPIATVLAILGVLILLVGCFTLDPNASASFIAVPIVGAVLFIVGIILAFVLKRAQLILNIYTDLDTSKGGIFVSANTIQPLFKRFKKQDKTRIKVNAEVAADIVATLGSIVLCK